MRTDVRRDLSRSSKVFVEIVWPAIEPLIGPGSRYVPVEGVSTHGVAHELDTVAGVDGFQIIDKTSAMRGLATRVQWVRPGASPYNTFSIRLSRPSSAKTEKEKRLLQVTGKDFGLVYPNLTVQAYLRDGTDELLSVGIAMTDDLYDCVSKHPSNIIRAAGNGGERFEAYHFDYLTSKGYVIRQWHKPTPRLLIGGKEVS